MAGRARGGLGGRVAIAAGCALLAVCLAGGPLYISSSASESVQLQLATTCLGDVAFHLPFANDPELHKILDRSYVELVHADKPVDTLQTQHVMFTVPGNDLKHNIILMNRSGQETQVDPHLPPLGPNEIAVPAYLLAADGISIGGTIMVQDPATFTLDENGQPVQKPPPPPREMKVVASYNLIPVLPEPSYWCGQRHQLRPTPTGDLPTPIAFASPATVEASDGASGDWEVRPLVAGMTRDDAEAFQRHFEAAFTVFARGMGQNPKALREQFKLSTGMQTVVDRAQTISQVVGRTMAPVRLGGVAASLLLLIAAGAMLARERRRELRLLALRGISPSASMTRLLLPLSLPVLAGTIAGFAIALEGVRVLGPTPELETGPVRTAALTTLIGALLSLLLVAGVTARTGNRMVDSRPRRHVVNRIPFELIVVVLAVLAYRRLDKVGGVRLVGASARGGDLLAQAFPLLAVGAPLAVLARPLRWLAKRLRLAGRRLPMSLRLGLRRAVGEPGSFALVVVATALASGCIVLASTLSTSAERALRDKATTYLGSDEFINVTKAVPLPPGLADRATTVGRFDGIIDGKGVDVLAVDPAELLHVARWRSDASSQSLETLLHDLVWTPGKPVPAIVVNGPAVPADFTLEANNHGNKSAAHTIGTARFFPGYRNGAPLVVVDIASMRAVNEHLVLAVWVRDPPPDASKQLAAAGTVVTSGQGINDVFDIASFRAVRWSYAALTAFGVLIALVVLTMQLLVIDARRESRQAAHVLMRRMGTTTGDVARASLFEIAMPLLLGLGLGFAVGAIAGKASVRKLDTLRNLQPKTLASYDLTVFVVVGVAAVVGALLLSAVSVVNTLRARPMEVMRGSA